MLTKINLASSRQLESPREAEANEKKSYKTRATELESTIEATA